MFFIIICALVCSSSFVSVKFVYYYSATMVVDFADFEKIYLQMCQLIMLM